MYCVRTSQITEETIKNSRFIGIIAPCCTEADGIALLKQFAAKHPNANHIAFAYRFNTPNGIKLRYFDAGEPRGTAGKPIYQHLEGKNLVNCIITVIRYFGGIKLGAGGLTRAYAGAAKRVIEASTLIPFVEYQSLRLKIAYNQLQLLEYQLRQIDGKIVAQDFSDCIDIEVSIPAERFDQFKKAFPAG